jgi:DNA-binding SARP family transcriptional activator/Tfp pilus assembly protein PilF
MRFRILGPLEARSGEDWVSIGTDKPRSLFACLLLNAGQVVSTDTLIFELWGGAPPPTASNLISVYVHQLRRAIGDDAARVLIHRKPGYQVTIGAGDTDLQRFESLVTIGRDALDAGDANVAAGLLAEAEGLWRGKFLADVTPSALITTEAERTTELRLSAAELRVTADLECGRHAEVIPELRRMVAEYPLRERLWLLLMRALSDAGRHAESVSTYGKARLVIAEQLGVDPGPELQQFYAELLTAAGSPAGVPGATTDDPIPAGTEPIPAGTGPLPAGPAQLPAGISEFTGRETQVDQLCGMLTRDDAMTGPGAVRIAVIAGAAGLGKTALAVQAAHRVRASFPDGQLYADLSGASAAPAEPGKVLARFLRDLGVDGENIPVDDEERAALLRTRLSGQRVLILLDDAKDTAQVRPLLPGSPSCAVLVTSRERTLYLVSSGFIDLSTLQRSEALKLFSRIAGDGRTAAEPEATAEIMAACGGLPLAVRICAARLAQRSQWRIATMAARLLDEHRRLDELRIGDLEVRASFQVSYDSLTAVPSLVAPARAFRMLGLWQGQRIGLPAAAALIGEREAEVASALETLVDANLLESPEPDWYQLHDLLRLFAAERVRAEEDEGDRRAATGRLLQWYLEMASAAAGILSPYRYRIPGEPPPHTAALDSATGALAWYDSEQGNMIAAIRQAAAAGLHDVSWRLATALTPFFARRENWAECITAHRIAVASARAAGNRQGEAWALNNLGTGLQKLGETEAFARLEEALAIRREMADLDGEAQTLISLADSYYKLKGPREAYDHSLRHLGVLRRAGNPALLGSGLNNHGEFCMDLEMLDEAADCLQEALAIWTTIKGHGVGYVLENLGRIYLRKGDLSEAIATLSQAHRHHLANGHVVKQAQALKYLAEAQRDAGYQDRARESLTAALALYTELRADEEADAIQRALASMDRGSD